MDGNRGVSSRGKRVNMVEARVMGNEPGMILNFDEDCQKFILN